MDLQPRATISILRDHFSARPTDYFAAADKLDEQLVALRTDLTRAQLQASVLQEAVRTGIAAIDKAGADCAIRRSARFVARCPKCGASAHEGCGPEDRALAELERLVRAALTASLADSQTAKAEA